MKPPRKYHGLVGLAVLLVSETLMLAGVRPFTTWFYSFAWWSYILLVDQVVYQLRGNSLWTARRREFLLLVPVSVFIWMIFEGFNYTLQNWHYVNIIREAPLRWFGYFLAYGTVLPGLFETYELLDTLGLYKNHRTRPIPKTKAWHLPFVLIGILFLLGPIVLPKYCFPLVWGGFFFLLEPFLHARGGPSLMGEWERGSRRTFLLLLTSGFVCGVLWEFWNFWAVSKWVYTVPFVQYFRIFEMPILGFGGFPPFAVECYVMTNFLYHFRSGRGWRVEDAARPATTRPALILAATVFFCLFFVLIARMIDRVTVWNFI